MSAIKRSCRVVVVNKWSTCSPFYSDDPSSKSAEVNCWNENKKRRSGGPIKKQSHKLIRLILKFPFRQKY